MASSQVPDSTQPEINPEDSISLHGAEYKSYITLSNASTSSSRKSARSATMAKARELELGARLKALQQKAELEERRRRLQVQYREEEQQREIEESHRRAQEMVSQAQNKAEQLRRMWEMEEEEIHIKQLQAEIDIKAEYEAAQAIHVLLEEEEEEMMTPDSSDKLYSGGDILSRATEVEQRVTFKDATTSKHQKDDLSELLGKLQQDKPTSSPANLQQGATARKKASSPQTQQGVTSVSINQGLSSETTNQGTSRVQATGHEETLDKIRTIYSTGVCIPESDRREVKLVGAHSATTKSSAAENVLYTTSKLDDIHRNQNQRLEERLANTISRTYNEEARQDNLHMYPSSTASHESSYYAPPRPTSEVKDYSRDSHNQYSYNQQKPEFFSSPKHTSEYPIAEMVYQQGQLTKLLLEHNLKADLPNRIIEPYDGNPMKYPAFISAFEFCIEQKLSHDKERMQFLEQLTRGEANALVRSCMSAKTGYSEARKLLEKKYGNRHKIAAAYLNKLTNFPDIKGNDDSARYQFSILLIEYKTR